MAAEKEWVLSLQPRLNEALQDCNDGEWKVRVDAGEKLTYAYEIMSYNNEGPDQRHGARYETDLLVYDIKDNGDWIPRLVLECKTGSVTTHDALTYSTKASTHKHVHPYLRYGVLVGDFGTALPGRLIRHGAYFDFMMVWSSQEGTAQEWSELIDLLKEEVRASRILQSILTETRSKGRKKFRLLHRPLRLKESDSQKARTDREKVTAGRGRTYSHWTGHAGLPGGILTIDPKMAVRCSVRSGPPARLVVEYPVDSSSMNATVPEGWGLDGR